ncbi:ankyrin repeat domain-containing protein [Treponema saccharophilum]|uniref:Ankyrin n=1 Tax=Treponema saccharophilum DSM 2985 TaxID=907348 RepID=H7EM49_9SPIR|nr:ankyrin repeat domain-containing protein [Treponema saccharophilum]EIC01457.1 Ankyrin [Treponema saccharophilum DSM 2985]BDC97565.1 hypothetical protein TRSA_26640 [Treponema saccharophilum]
MFMDVEIPLWLIITFSVCVVAWPLILMAGGTAIVSLIVAAAAKSALALKVAGIAAAVFFSPLVIGILGAPILKILDSAGDSFSNSGFSEWKENTPLIRAVKKQNEKKIAKLLKKGADVNAFSEYGKRTPLGESCKAYQDEEKADRITALLLESGADANKEIEFKRDAMKNAVASKRHGAINLLCSHGYNFLAEDGKGNGIVEFAVGTKCYEEACILLELGAVPLERYDFGFRQDYTPFMFLLEESIFFIYDSNETEEEKEKRLLVEKKKASDLCRLFKLLLEKGVDVNAQTNDHRKMTALILLADRYATTRNDAPKLPIAKVLLDGGADVDIQDAYGKTALMCFAEISWATEITDIVNWIRLLVSYNADKTLRDEKGLTALDYFHRSCRRDDLKEAEIPVYDEIERLLTPEAQTKAAVTGRGKSVTEIERAENVQIALHLPLEDMSDDW